MGSTSSKRKHNVVKKQATHVGHDKEINQTQINTENGEVEVIGEPISGVFRRHGRYSVSNKEPEVTPNGQRPGSATTLPSTFLMTSPKVEGSNIKKIPHSLVDAIQLHSAPDVLKSLISSKDDCNLMWMGQARPLHLAVRTKQIGHVQTLISAGASIDLPDANGNTPLMVACSNGDYDVIMLLLDAGACVDVENCRGERALHLAVFGNCPNCVKVLLDKGADINAQDHKGNTSLIKACRHSYVQIIHELLDHDAQITHTENDMKRSALHYASFYCPNDVVRRLLDVGADIDLVDNVGDAPFVAAIKGKNAVALEVLLERGCDVYNVDGLNTTALGLACRVGDVTCVDVLLRHHQDPDETSSFGITPLIISVLLSCADIVRLLLKHGADPNKIGRMGETPIVHVFFKITPEVVVARHEILRELIRHGANVNHVMQTAGYFTVCPGKDNHSILVYALSSGYISMVRMLLLAGADLSYEEIFDWLVAGTLHGCKCIVHSQFDVDQIQEPVIQWFSQIRPLKILSRLAIRKHIHRPFDRSIAALPTAKPLKDFLNFMDLNNIEPLQARLNSPKEYSVVPIHVSFLPQDTLLENDYYQ